MTVVPDGLSGLVALAGNKQHIPFVEHRQRPRRSPSARSPISIAPGAPASTWRRISRGILAPRIVVGDDGEIGLIRRDAPHLGPLALVAVAAAAEHHDEPVPT